MKYIAKPYLLKDTDKKEFDDIEEAVKYLEDYTGHKMSYEKNRKTKEKTYDWELVGKLIRVKTESDGTRSASV
jgi:benzoyl-CoA reductase/2-hydroxyglutaryl-CoA dehydratase subunit BcrC/BadD/HgdB